MTQSELTLNEIVLLASLKLSEGNIHKSFTAEELVIESWKLNKVSFGLRGYEHKYPDSNNLYTKLMGKSGLVRMGYLKKIRDKTYTITEAGLSIASSLVPTTSETKTKVIRQMHDAIVKIINHPVFTEWLIDKNKPTKFRDAMWFWGIAPGLPPKVTQERLNVLKNNLNEAKRLAKSENGKIVLNSRDLNKNLKETLAKKGYTKIDEHKGKIWLDILDIERCIEFHETLKERFKKDLESILE